MSTTGWMTSVTRWIRRLLGPLVGTAAMVALLLWLTGAFRHRIEPSAPTPMLRPDTGVTLVAVRAVTVPVTETSVGSIQAAHSIRVASQLLARVQTMHVTRAGQPVKKDELLVTLDDRDLTSRLAQVEAALAAATAQLEQYRSDLAKSRSLFEQKIGPRTQVEQDATRVRTAEAEVARLGQQISGARTALSYAKLRSPIDGVVIDKKVQSGDMVAPGQVVVELYDPARMQLVASVRESVAVTLRRGARIPVVIEALSMRCEGTIDEIVPQAAEGSRSFQVKVVGPCPPGVYSGMFGRLEVQTGERRELRIPASAVQRVGQLTLVYAVAGDRLLRRFVRLGATTGDEVEVLGGLAAGERIVARVDAVVVR